MKKLVIALVALATVAQAGIYINFNTGYGITDSDFNPFLGSAEVATLTLVRVNGDRDIAVTNGGEVDVSAISLTDDTAVLTWNITQGTSSFDEYLVGSNEIDDTSEAGGDFYVYAVNADSSLIYAESTLAGHDITSSDVPAPTAATYQFGDPASGGVAASVIPEPATIGLMGIAAAGLFAARRKVRV